MRYAHFTAYDLVLLAKGFGVTLGLFAATSLIGLAIGAGWAVIRFYRVPLVWPLVTFLVELLKNSPVLVQLFLVFFGAPAFFQVDMTPTSAAAITLSANTAAFVYVIAVSGIQAVGREQVEASRVFGLTRWQTLRRVIAPQAAAFAVGPIVALLINQLQVTSLISVIGVADLTKIGNTLNFRTLKPFVVWTAVGLIYYLAAKLIAALGGRIETRLRARGAWSSL